MKILLVEDEKKVARFIIRGLKEQRYSVDHAVAGTEAEFLSVSGQFDLIILDLKLPDKDGLSVCKTIRKKSAVPILMLTARDTVKEKVAGLDAGADDYLIKPFAFAELLARIRALTRRSRQLKEEKELKIGELKLDLLGHRFFKGKTEIPLTSTEYKVLELFMRRPKEVITRTTLYEQVWGIDFDTDTNLTDVYINKLKNKIDPGKLRSYFKTIRGTGYVFTPQQSGVKYE